MEKPQPTLTLGDLLAHIVGGIADALSNRPDEAPHQRAARIRATAETIMAFHPADAIQAMLAGHCVIFHELIVDSVHHTLRAGDDQTRRPTRTGIVAMDKDFGTNLARLERYQTRDAETSPDVRSTNDSTETDIADRVLRHQSRSPARRPADPSSASSPVDVDQAGAIHMSGFNGHAAASASDPRGFAYGGNRQARRHASRNAQAIKTQASRPAP